jgi:DUSP domain
MLYQLFDKYSTVLICVQCFTRTTCRYVLDLKWYNAWKAYTDQRSAATETDQKVAELTLEETEVCLPPGLISNEALKELPEPTDDRKGELRKGLDEGYDYTLLPQAAYQQLETWYGGGPTFQRSVIERGGAPGTPPVLQIELYPVRFRWARCGADCLPDPATWQKQLFSRSLAVKQVRATIMHKLKLEGVNNVRISVHMAEDSEADATATATAAAAAAAPAQALPQPMDLSAPGVADTHVPEHDSSSSSSGDAMAVVQAEPSTGSNSTVAAAVNSEPALAEPLPEAVAHNDLTASAVVVEANEVLREKEGGWLIVPRAGEDAATSSTSSSSSSSSGVHVELDAMDTDDVSTGSHDVAADVVPSDEPTENSSATAAGDTAGDADMSTDDADGSTAVQHSPAVIPWQQAEMSTGADTTAAATTAAAAAVPASSSSAAAAVAQGADYWQVVSPKSMSQTLDSLLGDFHGRVDVLVESRASESDPFPRDAIVNAWRQQLKPGDLLDAKDGEGQWFESIVKEIVHKDADGVQVS